MSELALVAQWSLAVVLLVSAVAKLADRTRTADAVVGFGVPEGLRWAAPVVPATELVLSGMLVVPSAARWGAFGAMALLALFSIAITVNLGRGRRPACNCFGRLDDGPIGARTLVRNGLLLAVAVVAAQRDAATPGDLVAGVTAPVALALAAAVGAAAALGGLTWLVTELWRQQARLLLRIDALEAGRAAPQSHRHAPVNPGPPVGRAAPNPPGLDADGSPVSLSHHWSAGRDTLVVFGDPDCPACTTLHPEIAAWRAARPDHRHVVVVSRTARTPLPASAELLVEEERAASAAYGVQGTPSAVLVAGDGTVASTLAEGAEAVRALMAGPPAAEAGRTAPVRFVTRPARAGQVVADVDLPPSEDDVTTLLLFWNEGCGHCRGMISGLQERSARTSDGQPRLAFVVPSPEQASTVAARMPSATAVVDPEMRVNLSLGVPGTPSAALVGADRRLVADLAVGPDAVLALLDGR